MKYSIPTFTLFLLLVCTHNVFAQSVIKQVYKASLRAQKSYFELNEIEEDKETVDKFLRKNPDVKCVYTTGNEIFSYGEVFIPVTSAKFLIKSLREKDIEQYRGTLGEFIKKNESEYYVRKYGDDYYFIQKASLKNTYENFDDLFKDFDRYYVWATANALQVNYFTMKDPDKINKEEVKPFTDVTRSQMMKTNFSDKFAHPFVIEMEKADREKALNGTLIDCVEYYKKYGGVRSERRDRYENLPKDFVDKLKYLISTTDKLDEESEVLKKRIYEKAYSILMHSLPTKIRKSYDFRREEEHPVPFFGDLCSPISFYATYCNKYDPNKYAARLWVEIVKMQYDYSVKNYEEIGHLDKYSGLWGLIDNHYKLNLSLKQATNLDVLLGYTNGVLQRDLVYMTAEEKAKILSIKNHLDTWVPKSRREALNIHDEYDRKKAKEMQANCEACIVDFDKTTFPREEEAGVFFRTITKHDGTIVMKNGDKYYWTIEDDRWVVKDSSAGFVWPGRYKKFSDMIKALVENCERRYCN